MLLILGFDVITCSIFLSAILLIFSFTLHYTKYQQQRPNVHGEVYTFSTLFLCCELIGVIYMLSLIRAEISRNKTLAVSDTWADFLVLETW